MFLTLRLNALKLPRRRSDLLSLLNVIQIQSFLSVHNLLAVFTLCHLQLAWNGAISLIRIFLILLEIGLNLSHFESNTEKMRVLTVVSKFCLLTEIVYRLMICALLFIPCCLICQKIDKYTANQIRSQGFQEDEHS